MTRILLGLLIFPLFVQVSPRSLAQDEIRTIEIHASRFAFTPSEITLKKGETVKLRLLSDDVTHALFIPDLNVNQSEPDTAQLETLSNQEWDSLLAFTDLAHSTLLLTELPGACLPARVLDRLRTNVADNSLRFERVKATYEEAADALEEAGVQHM